MLTKDEVIEFKKLVLEVYGENLTFEEADNQGTRVIQLIELLLKNERHLVKRGESDTK